MIDYYSLATALGKFNTKCGYDAHKSYGIEQLIIHQSLDRDVFLVYLPAIDSDTLCHYVSSSCSLLNKIAEFLEVTLSLIRKQRQLIICYITILILLE